MRATGLDLSLTSTGVAQVIISAPLVSGWAQRIQPGKRDGHERLAWILDTLTQIPRLAESLVLVEGPSYNSKFGHEHERGGLWWMVTHRLWSSKIPFAVVPPALVKKYATGTGSGAKAGKDQVLAAVIRRYPMVEVNSNDEADALVLAAMGADHLGCPLASVPQLNRSALATIRWPVVTLEEAGSGKPEQDNV